MSEQPVQPPDVPEVEVVAKGESYPEETHVEPEHDPEGSEPRHAVPEDEAPVEEKYWPGHRRRKQV